MASSTTPCKRLSAELNPTDIPLRSTRRKPSPPPSSTTSTSVAGSDETPNSTTEATEYSSDSDTSTLSASSPEPSSDEESSTDGESDAESNESDGNITSLPLPPNRQARRQIYRETEAALSADRTPLRERLQAFLPKMAAANVTLEEDRAAGRLEGRVFDAVKDGDEEEGKQYIEMNLGLGVLEEKDPNKIDDSDEAEDDGVDQPPAADSTEDLSASSQKEKDVMGKLLGQKSRKPGGGGIEEISDQ